MKAIQTSLNAKDKIPLYKNIPLDTPLLVTIEPSGICTLKCKYCLLSLPKSEIESLEHSLQLMSEDIFDRIISDLSTFPRPIKSVVFARLGEPLLNKKMPKMIERLKNENICEKTLVISNGIPLTHQMSLDLVNAGLDRIKLSINGLSSADYLKNCGKKIDFEKLVSEIAFLYQIKGKMKIQIKILDKFLGANIEEGKKQFFAIFGDKCDEIDIEYLFAMFGNDINYGDLYFKDSSVPINRYNSIKQRKICSTPFYKLSIAADGRVEYCFSRGIVAGYLSETSLSDIWHSTERKKICLNLLECKHEGITEPCASCPCFQDSIANQDYLDPHSDELIDKINLSWGHDKQ